MTFKEAARNERKHIKESKLVDTLNYKFSKQDYTYLSHFITDDMGKDCYDLSICYQSKDGSYLRVYIEVKVRYQSYEDYFLQKDKYERIEKVAKSIGGKYLILYVNYCIDGTYIWDLRNVNRFKLDTRSCKQYTSKESNYVDKKVYLLPTDEAKYFSYLHNSEEDTYYIRFNGTELCKDFEI